VRVHDGIAQEQEEQFEEEQPEQDEPPAGADDLNLYPTENPKDDIFFSGFFAPQEGHSGSSPPKTMSSKSFPHLSHLYS
jgi:hypothetical protein